MSTQPIGAYSLQVQKQNIHTKRKHQNLHKHQSLRTVRDIVKEMDDYMSNRKRYTPNKKKQPQLDREQIKKQMKSKWTDPGYCNFQFSKFDTLRGKFLNEWEMERICLATRSYQIPKQAKPYKSCTQSNQFPKVTNKIYPEKFQEYLKKIQQKNQDLLFSPKQKMYTEMASTTLQKSILKNKKKIFQPFTTQNRAFGLGTVTWKSRTATKYKTFQED